jgi:hypothetical protein
MYSSTFYQNVYVGTLQTGYPYIQASNQDKEWSVHPRAATLQYRTLPSSHGGLWHHHVSSAPDPTS